MDLVSKKNVELSIERIRTESPILKELEDSGQIKILGAMYHVESGVVEFY
jgi:carbonic anhydrase